MSFWSWGESKIKKRGKFCRSAGRLRAKNFLRFRGLCLSSPNQGSCPGTTTGLCHRLHYRLTPLCMTITFSTPSNFQSPQRGPKILRFYGSTITKGRWKYESHNVPEFLVRLYPRGVLTSLIKNLFVRYLQFYFRYSKFHYTDIFNFITDICYKFSVYDAVADVSI